MRLLLTSFLTLHWAIVFALLGFVCIDGGLGLSSVLSTLGVTVDASQLSHLEAATVAAPLATAFMVVAVLFCWAFVEIVVNKSSTPDAADSVIRLAFIAAASVLLVVLIGGVTQKIGGLFLMVAVNLAALMTSYLATIAERLTDYIAGIPGRSDARAAARNMAQGASHASRLARIVVGRNDTQSGEGRRQ